MERQGLAPTPEQMARLREVQEIRSDDLENPVEQKRKKRGQGQKPFIRMTSGSPPLKQEINQIIYGIHWQYQKRMLDILKIVTDNEKWDTVRVIALDIINEQVETTHTLIGRRIDDHYRELKENQESGQRNGNGVS